MGLKSRQHHFWLRSRDQCLHRYGYKLHYGSFKADFLHQANNNQPIAQLWNWWLLGRDFWLLSQRISANFRATFRQSLVLCYSRRLCCASKSQWTVCTMLSATLREWLRVLDFGQRFHARMVLNSWLWKLSIWLYSLQGICKNLA